MVYHRNVACATVPIGTNDFGSRLGCIATPSKTENVATWPTPSTGIALTVSPTVLFGDGVENGSVSYMVSCEAATNF